MSSIEPTPEDELTDAESFFRALFVESSVPQWIVDLETMAFLEVNDSAIQRYGYKRETFLASDLRLVRPNDDLGALSDEYRRSAQHPGLGQSRRYRNASGQWLDAEIQVAHCLFKGHHAVLAQIFDQTEVRAAMESARVANNRIEAILRGALDAVISIDRDSRIIEWAGQSEQVFGWTRVEAIGQLMPDLIMPERYRELHFAGLNRYYATGQSTILGQIVDIEALRKGGEEFPARLRIMRVDRVSSFDFTAYLRDLSSA